MKSINSFGMKVNLVIGFIARNDKKRDIELLGYEIDNAEFDFSSWYQATGKIGKISKISSFLIFSYKYYLRANFKTPADHWMSNVIILTFVNVLNRV